MSDLSPFTSNAGKATRPRAASQWRALWPWRLAALFRTRRRAALALAVGALVYLGLFALLLYLASQTEHSRIQAELDKDAHDVALELRARLTSIAPNLQNLERERYDKGDAQELSPSVYKLFDDFPEVMRIEVRKPGYSSLIASLNRRGAELGTRVNRIRLEEATYLACQAAMLREEPQFSASTFIPSQLIGGFESLDLCMPISGSAEREMWVVTLSLTELLRTNSDVASGRFISLFLSDPDGSRLATLSRGAKSVRDLTANALVVLPGTVLTLGVYARQSAGFGLFSAYSIMAAAFSLLFFLSVVMLTRDILRRQRAESALSQSLAFRKAMEDSLLTGLRARDLQGRITYVNPAFCELVGYSEQDLVNKRPPLPYWPPESHAEYERRLARRLSGNLQRDVFESEYQHANGSRIPVLIYEAPLVNDKGEHTGWMASVLDVSEQRRIENVARAQQDKLAEASKLTTVGELASTLSHELNQPLAAIASFAAAGSNLLQTDASLSKADMQEIMKDIGAQADRAGRVIKSVRGFVRRGEGERVPLDMIALLEDIIPLVQLQARAARAQVSVDIQANLPTVMGDRTLLEQVVLNLTRNGFEAMLQTPIEWRRLQVAAQSEAESGMVVVSVSDAGSGIDGKAAAQLFTPFFTTKPEGMGLGLSICRNVIEQHGGNIHTEPHRESPSGSGTVFRFTLPPHDRLSRR